MTQELIIHDSETLKHVNEVRDNIWTLIKELDQRAQVHDATKFEEPERSIFAANTPKLAATEYGTPAYEKLLEEVKPAIEHHYAKNTHHPEFYSLKEEWRDVIGYENTYEVSDHGRLRNKNRDLLLNPPITPKGYVRVSLYKDGGSKNHMVHRLVADAFITNGADKPVVNHKDGVKTNNNISNLEWVTHSENQIHAYENDLKKAKVKYIVKCNTLDIVTEGCLKMEAELRSRGYERASSASIWACINEDYKKNKHLDLEFEGFKIEECGDIGFVEDMDLVDILEMIADWSAAAHRNKDGDIHKSIQINSKRFNINPQLAKIFTNTVNRYF